MEGTGGGDEDRQGRGKGEVRQEGPWAGCLGTLGCMLG